MVKKEGEQLSLVVLVGVQLSQAVTLLRVDLGTKTNHRVVRHHCGRDLTQYKLPNNLVFYVFLSKAIHVQVPILNFGLKNVTNANK